MGLTLHTFSHRSVASESLPIGRALVSIVESNGRSRAFFQSFTALSIFSQNLSPRQETIGITLVAFCLCLYYVSISNLCVLRLQQTRLSCTSSFSSMLMSIKRIYRRDATVQLSRLKCAQ